MRKSRYTDSPIQATPKQSESGVPTPELCREHGMSSATFYKWRTKFGGMDASIMKHLSENWGPRLFAAALEEFRSVEDILVISEAVT